jgi:hypothetical protein
MHYARVSIPLTLQFVTEVAHTDDELYTSLLAATDEVTEAKWADEAAMVEFAEAHAVLFGASFWDERTRGATTSVGMGAVEALCTRGVLPEDSTVADAKAAVAALPALGVFYAVETPALIGALRSLWGYFAWRRETPHLEAILVYLARPETADALEAALVASPPPRRGAKRRTEVHLSTPRRTSMRAPKLTKNRRKRARKARRAGRK